MGSIKTTMSGCTQGDKPLISIVMAVHHPRMDWLVEQLDSLNTQTYPNLELLICDDGPDKPVDESIFAQHITAFPWQLVRNEQNLGSNKTFERLTGMVNGAYIAYCDQDDIWLPEKMERYQAYLEETGALLVCSDMYIVDGEGRRTAVSMTQVRRHHVFREGAGLAPGLLVSNFVTGCAMMICTDMAKATIPFCPYMVHDHYMALYAASRGKIAFINVPLISYRIHESNQTLSMAGVRDKASYLEVRIRTLIRRLVWLKERFLEDEALYREIEGALTWAQAREANFLGHRSAKGTVWRLRRYSPPTALFELLLSQCPERLFMSFVELKRKNMV